ncbi:Fpg/Nei family DNA glycosylase [Anaerobacillus sp. MEB173]|uniref:Fpg/Nei family DNA glycosylase n=1 Tax=Anaerobacillus sp. MEB173 TaxID=3383345 RepID=UPI003F91F188
MPELPEMETYKRLLHERVRGKKIDQVIINREKSINVPVPSFLAEVQSATVVEVERKAKHLLFHLNSGKTLLLHLMLGGWMYFGPDEDSPDRTKQIILSFQNGNLYFIGLRLGYLHLVDEQYLKEELADLGPEPLDPAFTKEGFFEHIRNRRGMLKTTLVNQSFLSGIGNCYSDEICFQAQLHPATKADELTDVQKLSLYEAIRQILQSGIAQGGYMDHPFFMGDQLTGGYKTLVYDREDQPCFRCKNPIQLEELSSKKSFFCPVCQH